MDSDNIGGLFIVGAELALSAFFAVCLWRIYTKAGRQGWKALIPFYNFYMLLKIVGKPSWWLVLLFIPIVNFITLLVICVALAKVFNKGQIFGVFLLGFLPIIGYPILAFGKSTYTAAPATPSAPPAPAAPPAQPTQI